MQWLKSNSIKKKIEVFERDKKRNNLILTGMFMETQDNNKIEETMKIFIKKQSEMKVKIKK